MEADNPLMIGLDVLKREELLVDYFTNKRIYNRTQNDRPLRDKHEGTFLEWPPSTILFSTSELRRLHYHFLHP